MSLLFMVHVVFFKRHGAVDVIVRAEAFEFFECFLLMVVALVEEHLVNYHEGDLARSLTMFTDHKHS